MEGTGPFHHYVSGFFDWDQPPLRKNFLQVDASRIELRIRYVELQVIGYESVKLVSGQTA